MSLLHLKNWAKHIKKMTGFVGLLCLWYQWEVSLMHWFTHITLSLWKCMDWWESNRKESGELEGIIYWVVQEGWNAMAAFTDRTFDSIPPSCRKLFKCKPDLLSEDELVLMDIHLKPFVQMNFIVRAFRWLGSPTSRVCGQEPEHHHEQAQAKKKRKGCAKVFMRFAVRCWKICYFIRWF